MIRTFESLVEKDRNGHPKTVYAVLETRNRNTAFEEVAKHKKQKLSNIKLTHSASVGVIYDNQLYWANHADREVLDKGIKCWAVKMKNEEHHG